MQLLQKKHWKPSFDEVHQYALDLQRITALRDQARTKSELERYDNIIEVMQEVMLYLNTEPKK